jgi:hypothetical protein
MIAPAAEIVTDFDARVGALAHELHEVAPGGLEERALLERLKAALASFAAQRLGVPSERIEVSWTLTHTSKS